MKSFSISSSILSANFAYLGKEVSDVLSAGSDSIHFDVMDNHYVPNLTFGPMVCAALRKYGITAPIHIHLMVSPLDSLIGSFIEAGATSITIHPDATTDLHRSIELIRQGGCKVGLAFNPSTSLDSIKYVHDKIDSLLIMGVNPGFPGQKFIPATFRKIREARLTIDSLKRPIRLGIDGGVGIDNIQDIARAGIDTFVTGSLIFSACRYSNIIKEIRALLNSI